MYGHDAQVGRQHFKKKNQKKPQNVQLSHMQLLNKTHKDFVTKTNNLSASFSHTHTCMLSTQGQSSSKVWDSRRLAGLLWRCQHVRDWKVSPSTDLHRRAEGDEETHRQAGRKAGGWTGRRTHTHTWTHTHTQRSHGPMTLAGSGADEATCRPLPFSFVRGTTLSCSSSASPSRPLLHSHPLPPDSSSIGRPREP